MKKDAITKAAERVVKGAKKQGGVLWENSDDPSGWLVIAVTGDMVMKLADHVQDFFEDENIEPIFFRDAKEQAHAK